jgi:hypothetical protein
MLVIAALLVVAWGVGRTDTADDPTPSGEPPSDVPPVALAPRPGPSDPPTTQPSRKEPEDAARWVLPGGGRTVFGGDHDLVAYYGTGRTPALGVLGEADPDTMDRRLRRAAARFAGGGRPLRHVYELIVTIADRRPGHDRDYSHDVSRSDVRRYVRAAHRNGALLLLDLQPGRSPFPAVARRWAWALRDPWVGLALDPEWRMGRHQVPARTVGRVSADEVNRTSAWLARLTRSRGLPEKLFVLHQFRASMIEDIDRVRDRPGLATVQHVDGFGTRRQKLATYRAVARPKQFTMGFKLFYDEDVRRMGPAQLRDLRPRVRFVSFQ